MSNLHFRVSVLGVCAFLEVSVYCGYHIEVRDGSLMKKGFAIWEKK